MKPTTLLLIASLFANIALVAYVATRNDRASAASTASGGTPENRNGDEGAREKALRAALASGDAAAMQAAGVPADLARELALGRMFARLGEKLRVAKTSGSGDGRWWRRSSTPGLREQQLLARRELSDALIAAFGDDFGLAGGDASQLAFLPPAKREALRKVIQDYDEMMAKFSAAGVPLASDRERLRLLRAERDRDIAALLSPEEYAAYEMRTSTSAAAIRGRYGEAIENETEFQALYALQKAFDEKFPREALTGRISPETIRARNEAERQLENEIRATVGDDRYAALRRAADPDVRTLDSLVSRLGLPATTTDSVLTARESFSAESQRISSDQSLSVPERRAAIQALAATAKNDLTRTLGAEAADAYSQRSPWVSMLQSGMAYSTTPQPTSPTFLSGGQTVYPVMPAGAMPANAERMIISTAPAIESTTGGDALLAPTTSTRVMSFTSSTVDPTSATGPVRKETTGTPPSTGGASTPKR